MSARVQRQLALALRSAKAARHSLYAAWAAENFPLLRDALRDEHRQSCGTVVRLGNLLRSEKAKPARHDGRKAASGE